MFPAKVGSGTLSMLDVYHGVRDHGAFAYCPWCGNSDSFLLQLHMPARIDENGTILFDRKSAAEAARLFLEHPNAVIGSPDLGLEFLFSSKPGSLELKKNFAALAGRSIEYLDAHYPNILSFMVVVSCGRCKEEGVLSVHEVIKQHQATGCLGCAFCGPVADRSVALSTCRRCYANSSGNVDCLSCPDIANRDHWDIKIEELK